MEMIKIVSYYHSEIIFAAGESLKVPVSTAIVAISICHFYFLRRSYIQCDFRDIAMGAMFLACKSEETLRKSYQIAAVFDYIFKVLEGQKGYIKILELNSPEYEYMKNTVLKAQTDILFELGFQIYKLFDIPHRYAGILLKTFDRHPKSLQISQKTWIILNDLYKTQACLYYPGQIIASASVYLALAKLHIPMPTVPWWILMEANLQSIEQIIIELEELYSIISNTNINIDVISRELEQVGQKNHGLVNVFPVNYYRKIMLGRQNKLRIKVIDIIRDEQKKEKAISEQKSSSQVKKKKHKKSKDKHKRKEKQKRKHTRRSSSSQSSIRRSREKKRKSKNHQNKLKSSSEADEISQIELKQERNNDQTPKLEKFVQNVLDKNIQPISINEQSLLPSTVIAINKANPKDLLSKISSQLKKHEEKKLKMIEKQDESDEELLAELIKIKKSNINKGDNQAKNKEQQNALSQFQQKSN